MTVANCFVDPDLFGKNHWSTFCYAETVCVDQNGLPDPKKMRCNDHLHPEKSHMPAGMNHNPPTILKNGEELHNHDDWSCIEDLEVEAV